MSRRIINNLILCEVEGSQEVGKSGFEAPQDSRFKYAKVIDAADDDIKKGDRILIPINSGDKHFIYNKECLIVHRREIIWIE